MSDSSRFENLWQDFLEDELNDADIQELHESLADDAALQSAADEFQLHRLLSLQGKKTGDSPDPFVAATMQALTAPTVQITEPIRETTSPLSKHRDLPRQRWDWRLLASIAAGFVLTCLALFNWPNQLSPIEICALQGDVILTTDNGKVSGDLAVGDTFQGGSLELLTPGTWCQVRFPDQTTATFSGRTLLTVSQDGQKVIRLRQGNLSANVTPQTTNHPLLVYTEAAELEVLGTQFNVEAQTDSTRLVVNRGSVLVKRRNDGKEIEVPASYSIATSLQARDQLTTMKREQPVSVWKVDWQSDVLQGKVISQSTTLANELKEAIKNGDMSKQEAIDAYKKGVTLNDATGVWALPNHFGNTVVLSIASSSAAPVTISPASFFRISGYANPQDSLTFGFNANQPDGGFAGKFSTEIKVSEVISSQATTPKKSYVDGEFFEVEIPIDLFSPKNRKFKNSPLGKELSEWWCVSDSKFKLQILDVELIDSATETVDEKPVL